LDHDVLATHPAELAHAIPEWLLARRRRRQLDLFPCRLGPGRDRRREKAHARRLEEPAAAHHDGGHSSSTRAGVYWPRAARYRARNSRRDEENSMKRATDNGVDRRGFLRIAAGAAAALPVVTQRAYAQAKPTITYWNGLTGADGKVMDELLDQFTKDTGVRVEQQRIQWADLYPKLQVSVPAGQGPDIALIHTAEVPHLAADRVLEAIHASTAGAKGFRGDDYLPSTWQGGLYQGKRYAIPLDVPQHILYLNVKVMRDAGLVGTDGKPKVPGSREELVAMAKRMTKGDTFGFSIGT